MYHVFENGPFRSFRVNTAIVSATLVPKLDCLHSHTRIRSTPKLRIMSAVLRSTVFVKAGRLAAVPAVTRGYATSIPARAHHQVLIVGGGTAGITVAAQLKRARGSEKTDIAILDPAAAHHYQVCARVEILSDPSG